MPFWFQMFPLIIFCDFSFLLFLPSFRSANMHTAQKQQTAPGASCDWELIHQKAACLWICSTEWQKQNKKIKSKNPWLIHATCFQIFWGDYFLASRGSLDKDCSCWGWCVIHRSKDEKKPSQWNASKDEQIKLKPSARPNTRRIKWGKMFFGIWVNWPFTSNWSWTSLNNSPSVLLMWPLSFKLQTKSAAWR